MVRWLTPSKAARRVRSAAEEHLPPHLGPALLTRDWETLAAHAGTTSKDARLAGALVGLRDGEDAAVVAGLPEEPGEALRYLGDVARWRLGTLADARGAAFAEAFGRLHADDLVTVATIQKSGTHWMRFFLTNYARALADPAVRNPISYPQLLHEFYGNNRWQVFRGAEPYREPSTLLAAHGVSDVTMQHFRHDVDPFVVTPGRKIMLYRNPLDYVVSLFHYTIKQRPQHRDKAEHPRDVLEQMLGTYALHYLTLDSYRGDPDVHVASYEALKADPGARFRDVVRFLGLPLVDDAVDVALALSDISTVRAMEERTGRSMVVKLDGYFTRDGSIGQWKEFLDDADVELARRTLAAHGVDLGDFTVDG
ncbi:sulfotransferase domain-containing protein [Isoptericola sp. 4D.3]|uniref:Sulfotransferase domain-containing protein n=1 Tax=Isoptericola peretonis TaxID=2918523 RepID=A0ABT0J667_9MICO|nr:sulfotransferase domain-containing protein [Isoptericola sp. 4D.3]